MEQQLQILMDFQKLEKRCVAIPKTSLAHIYNYLINTPSAYTHENVKAYKSLEAFNFFACNHVQDVFHHSFSKELKFYCVKTKVKVKLSDFKNA